MRFDYTAILLLLVSPLLAAPITDNELQFQMDDVPDRGDPAPPAKSESIPEGHGNQSPKSLGGIPRSPSVYADLDELAWHGPNHMDRHTYYKQEDARLLWD